MGVIKAPQVKVETHKQSHESVELPKLFNRYHPKIEERLRELLSRRDELLYRMMRYHLGFADEEGYPASQYNGKALRPMLCLFTNEALGGEWRKALPAACAVELVHNFSLIHDDIQDHDLERHHCSTVWAIWGEPQAINAGDGMRELASLALLDLQEERVALEKILRASQILHRASLEMIEGQYLDISFEKRLDVTVQNYLDMILCKTGALMACSLELGALLASKSNKIITTFQQCGRSLGLAFQIRDDILGIWGDEHVTGKSRVSDILRKKKSLPIIYALGKGGISRDKLIKLYSQDELDHEDGEAVFAILEETGARLYAQRMAEEKCKLALERIKSLHLPAWAERTLSELTDFLLHRER